MEIEGFKLTDQNHETFGKTKWGEGITHTASGRGKNGWIHFYKNPKLAVFFNHFIDPVLWECTVDGIIKSNGTKYGCTKLTTNKIIEIPILTIEQRIKFAILCTKEVYKEKAWNQWADNWLDGSDRGADAAAVAAYAKADIVAVASHADAAYFSATAAYCNSAYLAARTVECLDLDLASLIERIS